MLEDPHLIAMGLFSRNGSRSVSSATGGHDSVEPRRPGLEPLPSVPSEDGRGHSLASTTRFFDIGVAGDWNYPNRKSMEDTSVVIVDYLGVPGCAYFAVFDGHAGAQCAQAAAEHMHVILADVLDAQGPTKDVAWALSTAFQRLDEQLHGMEIRNSGATAAVSVCCFMSPRGELVAGGTKGSVRRLFVANVGDSRAVLGTRPAALSATPGGPGESDGGEAGDGERSTETELGDASSFKTVRDVDQYGAVVSRRLSYDHRCSDVNEQRRVANSGGLVVNNRVNGMLAVTRSLGDLFMKDYVVGAPYTTETELDERNDDFLVLACDGLYDVCSDDKTTQTADAALRQGRSAAAASSDLLDQALQAFSMDNITVMVVKFTR